MTRHALLALLMAATAAGCASTGQVPSAAQLSALQTPMDPQGFYLTQLASSARDETRDESWASATEAALRASYTASAEVPKDALISTECRRTKCALAFRIPTDTDPKRMVEGQIAIDRWISTTQPCAYTIATPLAATAILGAFDLITDCRESRG